MLGCFKTTSLSLPDEILAKGFADLTPGGVGERSSTKMMKITDIKEVRRLML